MLECTRIDVSKRIGINKTTDCIICHYWYFLQINFRFQPQECDSCHELMQKALSFNNKFASCLVKEGGCRIHLWFVSKSKAINLLTNTDLI